MLLILAAASVVLSGAGVWAYPRVLRALERKHRRRLRQRQRRGNHPAGRTGTVVSIGADDGDLVREAEVLINFDPNDAEVGLQQRPGQPRPHRAPGAQACTATVDGMPSPGQRRRKPKCRRRSDNFNRRKNLAAGGAISPGRAVPRPRRPDAGAKRPWPTPDNSSRPPAHWSMTPLVSSHPRRDGRGRAAACRPT